VRLSEASGLCFRNVDVKFARGETVIGIMFGTINWRTLPYPSNRFAGEMTSGVKENPKRQKP
jgi:hypothetical protein